MINKYAEIKDRLVLYNACKGVLRVKQAMIANTGSTGSMVPNFSNPDKSGLISSLDYNPATGGSFSQERRSRLNPPFNLPLQPFQQQPQAPGQQQTQQQAPQGVDPNQWQQFQQWQQMMQQFQQQQQEYNSPEAKQQRLREMVMA